MSDLHELLPWYMNGTLDAGERTRFETHLAECQACRDEMPVIEELRRQVQDPDWDALAEHPSPEALAALLFDGAGDTVMRRHLAVCVTCAEEALWLKGDRAGGGRLRSSGSPAPVWRVRAALAAAAVLAVALIVAVAVRPAAPGRPTGLLSVDMVPSSERGGIEPHVVRFPTGADGVNILFEIDLRAEDFPASFSVRDANDRVVFITKVDAADLYRGTFLLFACGRGDCPDGLYVARVSAVNPSAAAIDYPFRLISVP